MEARVERGKKADEKPANHVVNALARAMRNTSFYASDHPLVRLNVEEASQTINWLLEKNREFVIKIVEGEIIADDQPLFDPSTGTANLVGACLRRGIESSTFLPGVSPEEVAAFITVLVSDPDELEERGGAASCLNKAGVASIKVERLLSPNDTKEPTESGRKTYASALDVLRAAARRARTGASPEAGPTHQVVSDLLDSIMYEQTAMLGLISVKGRDEYTFTHALHICILCLELGSSLGLERDKLEQLGVCAMLHDIGKIFVPLPILRKPAALSREEFEIIQQHPMNGALLLCRHENAPAMAPLVAFEHHLHYDFSGYPAVSRRRDLNFYSLLVGPADVYDALTTDRPYRPALSPLKALEVMHSQASHFEPRILTRFTEMLGKHPAGSLVRLDDGRLAVVTRPNFKYIDNPFVRLLHWQGNQPLLEEAEFNLAAPDPGHSNQPHTIDSIIDPATLGLNVSALLGGNLYCTE